LGGVDRGDPTVPNRNFELSVIRSDLVRLLAANRMRKRGMPLGPPFLYPLSAIAHQVRAASSRRGGQGVRWERGLSAYI
jgi:hypothetical protein